jgi:ribosomal protein L35AE/L33A
VCVDSEPEHDVAQDDIAARMIEALAGASSLQLCQLRALIDGMLAEPKRTMQACADLHLGQAVRFVDFRTGELRQGKVIAKHPAQASVLEEATRRTWKIPDVSFEAAETTPGDMAKPYDPPPEPARRPGPAGFAVGDRVTFDDGKGGALVGVVSRINRRTASVVTDNRQSWRVGFPLLRHVVEV